MATSYLTLTELHNYSLSGVPATGADTELQLYLNAAALMLDAHCHTKFEATAVTGEYSGDGERVLHLRKRPVISITSVTVDSSAWADGTDYELVDDRRLVVPYSTEYNPRTRLKGGCWPHGTNNISVVYSYGYSAAPDDVKFALAKLVEHLYANDGSEGVASESLGPRSITYVGTAMPGIIGLLLAPYVEHGVYD